jgi:hypothetical protein
MERPEERDAPEPVQERVPPQESQELRDAHESEPREDEAGIRAQGHGGDTRAVEEAPPQGEGGHPRDQGQGPGPRARHHDGGAPEPAFVLVAIVQMT